MRDPLRARPLSLDEPGDDDDVEADVAIVIDGGVGPLREAESPVDIP